MLNSIRNIIGKRKEDEKLQASVRHSEHVSAQFIGMVQEHNPMCIYPASYLPYPKDDIQTALEVSLAAHAKDEEKKKAYVSFLMQLPRYRDDVSEPLSPLGLGNDDQNLKLADLDENKVKAYLNKTEKDPDIKLRRAKFQALGDDLKTDLKAMQKHIEKLLADLPA